MLYVFLNSWVHHATQKWDFPCGRTVQKTHELIVINNQELLGAESRYDLFCRAERATIGQSGGCYSVLFLGEKCPTTVEMLGTVLLKPILDVGAQENAEGKKRWWPIISAPHNNMWEKIALLTMLGLRFDDRVWVVPSGTHPAKLMNFTEDGLDIRRGYRYKLVTLGWLWRRAGENDKQKAKWWK